MTGNQKIPALRFKEFEEEWEEKILGDIATFAKGKGISKSDISSNGKFECIRYGELYTHYNELIKEIISKTDLNENELIFSEYNDVIIPGSGETQLDIATASCVLKEGVALGGDLNIIKTKNNGIFLAYYLNNPKKKDIAVLAQGNSVVHLYSSQLKTLKLNLPKKEEQRKIASFLTAVDDKIQQLTKKKALLEQYKKGVIHQIFNQQIRFKDDDGNDYPDWEEKKLGDVVSSIKAGKTKPENDGLFNVYGSTGIIGYCKEFSHSGSFILIARVGANAGKLDIVNGKFGVTDNTLVVAGSNYINLKFLFYSLLIYNLNRLVFGSGQPLITGGQLSKLLALVPCKDEQQKIANFLTGIDGKINAVAGQLEQTQVYKKGLLQQMFI